MRIFNLMNRCTFLLLGLIALNISAYSQSNADDYWLFNGFSDGETVTTNSGWFYDDGGDGLYQEGQDWSVEFCSENGNPITLDFSGFRTHFGGTIDDGTWGEYDYITIDYPGGSYVAYNDDTPEFSFTSPDGCMTIGFISDNDGEVDSGWVAEIFAIPAPDNNDPADAEELIVGNSCSPSFYTNKGAYSTTDLESPDCKEFFGGDVWFRLVVPDSGAVKIETFAGTLNYAILDIYRSNDAVISSGERIECVDGAGNMPSVTLTSPMVSPGDILYVRLFGEQAKSGLFGICATDPSAPVTGYTGPGGVGDSTSLDFWYKADSGLLDGFDQPVADEDQVETWLDQSGNDQDLVQANAGFQPRYDAGSVNGFGTVNFDGDDLFSVDLGSAGAPLHWFAAGAFDGSLRQTMLSVGDADAAKTASISRHTDDRYFSYTSGDKYGPDVNDGQFYLFHAAHLLDDPYHFLELNGVSEVVDAETEPLLSNGVLKVGASWDDSDPFNGTVSELIQYRKSLNEAQEIIVNNYLSAKYDIALPAAVDHYAYTDTFYYDVAGIGRVSAGNMHTKAESAGILAISGADDLNNGEFLLFGHDGGDFSTWSSASLPVGDTNIVRLVRIWRVAQTGSPGSVSVSLEKDVLPALPTGFSAYNILIDGDGDFSSGAETYGPFEIGSELVVNNVALNDGDYVTVAAVRPVVSFTSPSSAEFESVSNPQIEVVLNYAMSEIVEIDYAVVEANAQQGVDFSLLPSSISIDPGNKTGYIIPLILDDTIPEIPDEYFDIEISTATPGVTAGGITRIRHTILNDDLSIEVTASDTIIGSCSSSDAELVADPTGTGPFTFAWTPVDGLSVADNDTVIANPASTTTYTVEVTDTFGLSKTEEIEIVVVPAPTAPTITVAGSTTICSGDSVKLSAPKEYSSYLWSTTEISDSIYAKTAGDYYVIVKDSFECSSPVSADLTVTVNPLPAKPVIDVDGDQVFCLGDSVKLSVPSGFDSYLWSTGQTTNEIYAKATGDYNVSVTNSYGCESPVSDEVSIAVDSLPDAPVLMAFGATTFCDGDSVELVAGSGYSSYLWSDGTTGASPSLIAKTGGEYYVSGTDGNGCSSENSDTVTVTVNPLPPQPVIEVTGDPVFCPGDSVKLSVPSGFDSYLWSTGQTTNEIYAKAAGDYSVSVTNSNGCESPVSEDVSIAVHAKPDAPDIAPVGATTFCEGDSVRLDAEGGYISFLWSDGSSGDSLIAKTSGEYYVSGTDGNGCISENSDTVLVTVNPLPAKPVIDVDGDQVFCPGDSVKLSVPSGFDSYLWSNGQTSNEIYAKAAGDYSVSVTNSNGCESPVSEDVSIAVHAKPDAPDIAPVGATTFCEGDSVRLDAEVGYTSYVWSDGSSGASLIAKTSGEYYVSGTDGNGCSSENSDTVTVTVNPLPDQPVISVDGSVFIITGDSVQLSGPASAGYLWTPEGETTQSIIVSTSGSYSCLLRMNLAVGVRNQNLSRLL